MTCVRCVLTCTCGVTHQIISFLVEYKRWSSVLERNIFLDSDANVKMDFSFRFVL